MNNCYFSSYYLVGENELNRKKGKENVPNKDKRLVNYKDLERNVRNEIATEFHDFKDKNKKGK
jgi:hypothetical protein